MTYPKRTCPQCMMTFSVLPYKARKHATDRFNNYRCSEPECGRRFHTGGGGVKGYIIEERDLTDSDRLILANGT